MNGVKHYPPTGGGQLRRVLEAWEEFKKHHDVKGIKLSCCDHSRELFSALDALEKHAVEFLTRRAAERQ